jgi:hypothetical protein
MAISRTLVLPDQFEIDDSGITHKPTGWKYDPATGTITKGTGDDFNLDQVADMGTRLWLQYCERKKKQ